MTCDTCYPRISRQMWNIGTVLLHEYIYWNKLVSPVTKPAFKAKTVTDRATGCLKPRLENGSIKADKARTNADSYAWLANEIWWTQACVGSHSPLTAPTEADE